MASVRVVRFPISNREVCHRAFLSPLVCVDDGSCSPAAEPQLTRDLLRDYETHRAGVDDPFDGRPSDASLDAVPAVYDLAVAAVLQRHAGSNLSHRLVLRF